MKRLLAVLLVSLGMGIAAPTVEAHKPYPAESANSVTYNVYQSHCGNGLSWVCYERVNYLSSFAVGEHSWQTWYQWVEGQVPWDPRACRVVVRVDAHINAIVQIYENEHCWDI